jgi:hypothetical protein
VKAPSVNNFKKLDHMAKRSPKLEAYYWRKERSPKQEANGWQRKTQNTYGCPREAENMRTLTMLQIPVSLNNGSK